MILSDHNSNRPEETNEEVATFFYYGLCVGELVKEDKEFIEKQETEAKSKK